MSMDDHRRRALPERLATVAVAVLLMAAAPGLGPVGTWLVGKPAWAKKDGGEGGHGGGSERGGKPDHAGGPERDDDGGSKKGKGHERASDAREPKGQGRGLERMIERLAGQDRGSARSRYELASGRKVPHRAGADAGEMEIVVELPPELTIELISRGWAWHERLDEGWRNHGERVRTMVEIAKSLGHPASVGALQANFGTPFENGLDPVPEGAWSVVSLDVNGDGTVDRLDLLALTAPPTESEGGAS
jgi:hypothetical protein